MNFTHPVSSLQQLCSLTRNLLILQKAAPRFKRKKPRKIIVRPNPEWDVIKNTHSGYISSSGAGNSLTREIIHDYKCINVNGIGPDGFCHDSCPVWATGRCCSCNSKGLWVSSILIVCGWCSEAFEREFLIPFTPLLSTV